MAAESDEVAQVLSGVQVSGAEYTDRELRHKGADHGNRGGGVWGGDQDFDRALECVPDEAGQQAVRWGEVGAGAQDQCDAGAG